MPPDATPAASAPSTPAAATPARASAVLDDTPPSGANFDFGLDASQTPNPPAAGAPVVPGAAAEPAKPDEAKKPDADDLVLELAQKTREASAAVKRAEAVKQEFVNKVAQVEKFKAHMDLAQSNPMHFALKMAESAGLDIDEFANAYAEYKSSGKLPEMTADQKVKLLERKIDQKDKTQTDKTKEQEAAETEAAIGRAHANIKGFAAAAVENFPLFTDPDEIDANTSAAFDLIALYHAEHAGTPGYTMMTPAKAVAAIEAELKKSTERRAGKLGFAKPAGAPPTATATPIPAATTPAPRQTPAASPAEVVGGIRSDDEIAADWAAQFGRR